MMRDGICVSEIATFQPMTVDLHMPIEDAAAILAEHGFRHLPVVARKRVCGMISERDVLNAIGTFRSSNPARAALRPQGQPVGEIMSTPALALPKNAPLAVALRWMLNQRISAVPIVDKGGKPLAIVSEIDVARAFDQMAPELAGQFVSMHMSCDVACVDITQPAAAAVALMEQRDCRELPVMDGDSLIGLVTDRDLLALLGETCSPQHALQRPVEEIMSLNPVTGAGDFTLGDVSKMFGRLGITAMPIIQGPELLGFISLTDIMRLLHVEMEDCATDCGYECGLESNKPFCRKIDRATVSA